MLPDVATAVPDRLNLPLDRDVLLGLFELMSFTRKLDEIYSAHDGHWHGLEGEEAVAAGCYYGLRPTDTLAAHYRGVPVASYAKGVDLRRLLAGLLARSTSYNRGRHRSDICGPPEFNLIGLYTGSLGPSLGYATGAALAAKLDHRDDVAVAVFGDGVSGRGDCHEAMNFAAVLNLGVVFVCQNNGFAISTASDYAVAGSIAKRGEGFGIPSVAVDGNDVVAVHDAVAEAIARARAGHGPSLIEARTFRLGGHFYSDTKDYRDPAVVEEWRSREPITRFAAYLQANGVADSDALDAISEDVASRLDAAFALAGNDPEPGPEDFGADEVYAGSA